MTGDLAAQPTNLRAAVDTAIAGFGSDARIGVAVSGGGDSMALLSLLLDLRSDGGPPLFAATVDHGLRDGSRAEALKVAAFCAANDVPHDILTWRDNDGPGNLQDRARAARRDLLTDWAKRNELDALMLGHTMDDQAETVLMRLARGSGVDGLAAMSMCGQWGDLPVLRPLLGKRRAALRAYLKSAGVAWVEDPSNEDDRFDRVRTRKAIAALGMSVERLATTASAMARARKALEAIAAQAAQSVLRQVAGCQVIDTAGWEACDPETRLRLLAGCIGWVNGNPYRPRLSSLTRVADQVLADRTATVSGCVLIPKAGTIIVAREVQAAPDRIAAGQVWDGRWRISGDLPDGAEIGAIGKQGAAQIKKMPPGLTKRAMWAHPGVWVGGDLVGIPGFWGVGQAADCIRDPLTFAKARESH